MEQIKITSHTLSNVNWENAQICPFYMLGQTDVWRIEINANVKQLIQFTSIIENREFIIANQYLKASDKNRYLLSRVALRLLLSKYLLKNPELLSFGNDLDNKPFLLNTNGDEIKFNISYAKDYILISVSLTEVGVDTEYIDPIFDFDDILTDFFAVDEKNYIEETNSKERFFTSWTKKEALAKAIGIGILGPINQFPILNGDTFVNSDILNTTNNWIIHSFYVTNTHVGSVARIANQQPIAFWDFDLNVFF